MTRTNRPTYDPRVQDCNTGVVSMAQPIARLQRDVDQVSDPALTEATAAFVAAYAAMRQRVRELMEGE